MSQTTDRDIRMKSEGDNDFHRMAKETILAMCSNDIDGKRVLKIEGYLSLTVESGEVFCFVIKEELDETEGQEDENSAKQVRIVSVLKLHNLFGTLNGNSIVGRLVIYNNQSS